MLAWLFVSVDHDTTVATTSQSDECWSHTQTRGSHFYSKCSRRLARCAQRDAYDSETLAFKSAGNKVYKDAEIGNKSYLMESWPRRHDESKARPDIKITSHRDRSMGGLQVFTCSQAELCGSLEFVLSPARRVCAHVMFIHCRWQLNKSLAVTGKPREAV